MDSFREGLLSEVKAEANATPGAQAAEKLVGFGLPGHRRRTPLQRQAQFHRSCVTLGMMRPAFAAFQPDQAVAFHRPQRARQIGFRPAAEAFSAITPKSLATAVQCSTATPAHDGISGASFLLR
jgi:hypothetical protein